MTDGSRPGEGFLPASPLTMADLLEEASREQERRDYAEGRHAATAAQVSVALGVRFEEMTPAQREFATHLAKRSLGEHVPRVPKTSLNKFRIAR